MWKQFSEYLQLCVLKLRSLRSEKISPTKMFCERGESRLKFEETSFHRRSSIRSFSRFVYAISFPEHHLNWRNFTKDSSLKISQGICCVDGDNLIWMAHSISTNWRSHCEDGRLIEFVWALIKCIIDCMCANTHLYQQISQTMYHIRCVTFNGLSWCVSSSNLDEKKRSR